MRLIDAEWITYVLRKIAQAEDKDLSKGEFGQGYVSGVYHAISVIKSTEACLPRVCKHCHLVQYHDNNYCDRCGRLIDKAPTVEERQHGHWIGKPLECSCCRAIFEKISGRWKYCPDCGAIMDGEPE
jgi:predicted amidophosphoribosyltransferase